MNIDKKKIYSWALYDWANSAFATTVMAGFFPIFFKNYWSAGADVNTSTFQLGLGNSISSIIVALFSPIIGAIADCGSSKKKHLLCFALLGIVMTGSLSLVQKGDWELAVILYVLASIGFSGSNIFYDSLLILISPKQKFNSVSALGFSLGYLGGGILFSLNVLMTLKPHIFGLTDSTQAVKVSFILVSIWWTVFSIPLFLFLEEPKNNHSRSTVKIIKSGCIQLRETFKEIKLLKPIFTFLLAYWLYIDGVDTVIRMAVDYGMSLGFHSNDLIIALLITQFVGFPATLLFGRIGQKWSAKKGIYLSIFIYMLATIWAYFMKDVKEFYAIAIIIGLVQGGIQALSRSYYSTLIPPDKSAEYFGFYNMLGKFAAVIGPLLMGFVSITTKSTRLSILSLLILFILGALILSKVQPNKDTKTLPT